MIPAHRISPNPPPFLSNILQPPHHPELGTQDLLWFQKWPCPSPSVSLLMLYPLPGMAFVSTSPSGGYQHPAFSWPAQTPHFLKSSPNKIQSSHLAVLCSFYMDLIIQGLVRSFDRHHPQYASLQLCVPPVPQSPSPGALIAQSEGLASGLEVGKKQSEARPPSCRAARAAVLGGEQCPRGAGGRPMVTSSTCAM